MRILRVLTLAVLGTIIGLIYSGRPKATKGVIGVGTADTPDNVTDRPGRRRTGETTWPQAANTVAEERTSFDPDSLEVRLGDTVTFLNRDAVPHAVRIDESDLTWQAPGESVEWKADAPGVYPYLCNIHPEMTGTIVVK
jgi:plastocyanin